MSERRGTDALVCPGPPGTSPGEGASVTLATNGCTNLKNHLNELAGDPVPGFAVKEVKR